MTQHLSKNPSVYAQCAEQNVEEVHILAILVKNEPNVLARITGLFSQRGFNIDSLTVAETDTKKHLSRITVVSSGTPEIIKQIKAQLKRLVSVVKISDLTMECPYVERELALIKIACTGEKRLEALQCATIFRARAVDSTHESFIFEVTGDMGKINAFIDLMKPLGLIAVSRTGVAAISRGSGAMGEFKE